MKKITFFYGSIFLMLLAFTHPAAAGLDDFNLTSMNVNVEELTSGGPDKDGIPALSYPRFVDSHKANYLSDNDLIVGVTINGESKAYPIRILNWHEIVNDALSDTPVSVTWCPLTRSAVTFYREVDGQILEFGVSGLLYKSNVVLYDRTNDGLWSQLSAKAITGKFSSRDLEMIPSLVTTWKDWRESHPNTLVLSEKTGYFRNYSRDPYAAYHKSEETMVPLNNLDRRIPLKSLIIGVKIGNVTKAYPFEYFQRLDGPLIDNVSGKKIWIESTGSEKAIVRDEKGNIVPSVVAYWFAWSAIYQDTLLYDKIHRKEK